MAIEFMVKRGAINKMIPTLVVILEDSTTPLPKPPNMTNLNPTPPAHSYDHLFPLLCQPTVQRRVHGRADAEAYGVFERCEQACTTD